MIDLPSPNLDDRWLPIELVVLHYTGMQSAEVALKRLTDPEPRAGRYPGPWQDPALDPETLLARVSTHYVVGEAGEVWRLVDEEKRAWHAGQGHWRGAAELNSRSIGIEIVNGGHDFGLPPYPDAQIAAVIALLRDILARRKLTPRDVIGHSDLAPDRKLDPGERFPWARLAEAGVSVWPAAPAPTIYRDLAAGETSEAVAALQRDLARFGYSVAESGVFDAQTASVVTAFQRRFRAARVDGVADAETIALAAALAA
ncbi:MAG: N-acetylmuramoyl-L-alanine amidase [Alphaproteobacteria bacterium]|nr:N-acetylmuramoyl-L-alanine amidase [Alphaproteobacteria bacterium]